jgi:uncharacterized Fe-S cluster-containing radical SAM superfamily protein
MKRQHVLHLLRRGGLPGQLVIQLTDRCNATCPQCGMNINERFPRHSLPLDDVKRMIDAAAQRGIAAVSFTGGEPLLVLRDLVTLIDHAGAAGIAYIRTGTNGFVFRSPDNPDFPDRIHRLAETLAATPLRNFWISIDSADPATHEKMRGFPGVLRGIERALPIFHRYGLFPSANLGINRNLDGPGSLPVLENGVPGAKGVPVAVFRERLHSGLSRFFQFVAGMGFSTANVCYPMSIADDGGSGELNAVYGATATSAIVSFSSREKAHLFDVLGQSVKENRARLRIFTPLCALDALKRQFGRGERGYPCRGGEDFFFIDAVTGHTYPCGYRGEEDLGVFSDRPTMPGGDSRACYACEWECFRDPSELGGPLQDLVRHPFKCLRRWWKDAGFIKLWLKDLHYYQACDFFDGRRPARPERLRRFAAGNRLQPVVRKVTPSFDSNRMIIRR